jgi:hypothetical protein
MTLIGFILELQGLMNSCIEDISNFKIEIDLDHCLDPNEINISVDFNRNKIIIIKGNCGL